MTTRLVALGPSDLGGVGMATYALVHGAWHGAWCWDLLVPELEQRDARTLTMDLPCDDPTAGCSDYADVVVKALDGLDDDVVIVGHSLGGLTIPIVAERRPVRRMVFLAAIIPSVGMSMADQLKVEKPTDPTLPGLVDYDEQHRSSLSPSVARDRFYHDCSPEQSDWAWERLRPQAALPVVEVTPLQAWPGVPSSYIVCSEDRVVIPDWSRAAARDRLETTAIELPGSHSPMISRPAALAEILLGL